MYKNGFTAEQIAAATDKEVEEVKAILASEKGYVCPVFHPGYNVNVVEGKHPILDDRMKKKRYVSNDWKMSEEEHIQLITGPNIGGKSTYMRQNALLVVWHKWEVLFQLKQHNFQFLIESLQESEHQMIY